MLCLQKKVVFFKQQIQLPTVAPLKAVNQIRSHYNALEVGIHSLAVGFEHCPPGDGLCICLALKVKLGEGGPAAREQPVAGKPGQKGEQRCNRNKAVSCFVV